VFLNDLILFAKGSIGPLVGFTNSDGSQIQYLLNAEIKQKKLPSSLLRKYKLGLEL